jgi:hypothetical protein
VTPVFPKESDDRLESVSIGEEEIHFPPKQVHSSPPSVEKPKPYYYKKKSKPIPLDVKKVLVSANDGTPVLIAQGMKTSRPLVVATEADVRVAMGESDNQPLNMIEPKLKDKQNVTQTEAIQVTTTDSIEASKTSPLDADHSKVVVPESSEKDNKDSITKANDISTTPTVVEIRTVTTVDAKSAEAMTKTSYINAADAKVDAKSVASMIRSHPEPVGTENTGYSVQNEVIAKETEVQTGSGRPDCTISVEQLTEAKVNDASEHSTEVTKELKLREVNEQLVKSEPKNGPAFGAALNSNTKYVLFLLYFGFGFGILFCFISFWFGLFLVCNAQVR